MLIRKVSGLAYKYEQIAFGNSANLQNVVAAEEQYIPEGGLAELRINFRYRFPGFGTLAQETHSALSRSGVVPWPGEWRIVFADPSAPVWYIRWKKGSPWAPVVLAAIVTLAIFIVAWTLFKVFKPTMDVIAGDYPWLIPVLIIGGFIVYFQYQAKKGEGHELRGREAVR